MSTNIIEDMKVNPNGLHDEWIRQASLYAEWADRHVEAMKAKDLLKIKSDAYKARLYDKVRITWSALGFDKRPTENAIEAYVDQDPDYMKMQEELAELNYQINLFLAARQALEHKKRAIEGLERLHLAGYYSSLTTSPEGQEIQDGQMRNAINAELINNSRIG